MPRSTLIGNRSAGRDRKGLRAYADAQSEVREIVPEKLQSAYWLFECLGPLASSQVVEPIAGERCGAFSAFSESELGARRSPARTDCGQPLPGASVSSGVTSSGGSSERGGYRMLEPRWGALMFGRVAESEELPECRTGDWVTGAKSPDGGVRVLRRSGTVNRGLARLGSPTRLWELGSV